MSRLTHVYKQGIIPHTFFVNTHGEEMLYEALGMHTSFKYFTVKDMRRGWDLFSGDSRFRVKDAGRAAFFLIPAHKLKYVLQNGNTVEQEINEFIIRMFGGINAVLVPIYGFWKDQNGATVYDVCHPFEVSFKGPERIADLLAKLAEIAKAIGEECIYFKAGEDAAFIYPPEDDTANRGL